MKCVISSLKIIIIMMMIIIIITKLVTLNNFFPHPTFCWARHCAGQDFESPAVCAHLWPKPWTRSWVVWSAAPAPFPRHSCEDHARRLRLRLPEDTRRTPATTSTRWWEQPSARSPLQTCDARLSEKLCSHCRLIKRPRNYTDMLKWW